MRNIFLFSNHIKHIAKIIAFTSIVIARAFVVLLRWNKRIKQNHFYYSTKNNFDNSLFIIEFDFKNALYYKIAGITKSYKTKAIILNLSNYTKKDVQFIIVGLFRKKIISIPIKTSNHLISIKTKAAFVKPIQVKSSFTEMTLKEIIIEAKIPNPQLVYLKHTLSINSPFNQNEFI